MLKLNKIEELFNTKQFNNYQESEKFWDLFINVKKIITKELDSNDNLYKETEEGLLELIKSSTDVISLAAKSTIKVLEAHNIVITKINERVDGVGVELRKLFNEEIARRENQNIGGYQYLITLKKQEEAKLKSLIADVIPQNNFEYYHGGGDNYHEEESSVKWKQFVSFIEEYTSYKESWTYEVDIDKVNNFEDSSGDKIWRSAIIITTINNFSTKELQNVSKKMESMGANLNYITEVVLASTSVDTDYEYYNQDVMDYLKNLFNN